MNRFLRDNFVYSCTSALPSEFRDDFSPLCSYADGSVGSLGATLLGTDDSSISLPSLSSRGTLDDEDTVNP